MIDSSYELSVNFNLKHWDEENIAGCLNTMWVLLCSALDLRRSYARCWILRAPEEEVLIKQLQGRKDYKRWNFRRTVKTFTRFFLHSHVYLSPFHHSWTNTWVRLYLEKSFIVPFLHPQSRMVHCTIRIFAVISRPEWGMKNSCSWYVPQKRLTLMFCTAAAKQSCLNVSQAFEKSNTQRTIINLKSSLHLGVVSKSIS